MDDATKPVEPSSSQTLGVSSSTSPLSPSLSPPLSSSSSPAAPVPSLALGPASPQKDDGKEKLVKERIEEVENEKAGEDDNDDDGVDENKEERIPELTQPEKPVSDVDDIEYTFSPGKSSRSGLSRYQQGLKNIIPIRTSKTEPDILPLESNGCLNYMTFGWLSPFLWKVFRSGIAPLRGLKISSLENAEVNADRLPA